MKNVILHDQRLEGNIAGFNGALIRVHAGTSLGGVFGSIRTYAGTEKLGCLFIACHGYAGENARAQVSMDAGGMGLQLGREDLTHSNVSAWRAIKDTTSNIVVFSCAAANTEKGNEGTRADGRYLMGALAVHTNATVYAADRIQWYHKRHVIDFGGWEGTLLRFKPDGTCVTSPEPAPSLTLGAAHF